MNTQPTHRLREAEYDHRGRHVSIDPDEHDCDRTGSLLWPRWARRRDEDTDQRGWH